MLDINKIYHDDCFNLFRQIDDKTIDLIICDLPYGITKNSWDSILDLDKLWIEYNRIIKDDGAILLFGQDTFSAKLIISNEKYHRYNIVWEKNLPVGFLNANKMPLKKHEDIIVFYKQLPTYNPQKTFNSKRKTVKKTRTNGTNNPVLSTNYGLIKQKKEYDSIERFPTTIWKFSKNRKEQSDHPTQKPVKLIEELIKTYSNETNLVLDNCAGVGTTGIACQNTNRNFILIEKEEKFFNIAVKKIANNTKI